MQERVFVSLKMIHFLAANFLNCALVHSKHTITLHIIIPDKIQLYAIFNLGIAYYIYLIERAEWFKFRIASSQQWRRRCAR